MSLHDRLAALEGRDEEPDGRKEKQYPSGWQPGVVWDGSKGEITTDSLDSPPTEWDAILAARGLNPDEFEVVGDSLRWCSYDGWKRDAPGESAYSAILYSFKAEIRRKISAGGVIPEDVYREVRKAKKSAKKAPTGAGTFVVALSDWQVGNCDGGGVEAQAERIADLVSSVPQRLADLRRIGYDIGQVAILEL